jgi:hypothetical protein
MMANFFLILSIAQLYGYRSPLPDKIDPRCLSSDHARVWVYFTDKGVSVEDIGRAVSAARSRMKPEAVRRRTLRRGITDYADLPLCEDYIAEIEARGGIFLARSKWLNAASFLIDREDVDAVARLPFVYRIASVAQFSGSVERESAVLDTAVFGLAKRQFQMFNIDTLSAIGVTGAGVRVGFLDSGLRRVHSALANINVTAEYDFLGGDRLYYGNTAVTAKYGLYTGVAVHRSAQSGNIYVFLEGDTVLNYAPTRDILLTHSTDDGFTWSELKKVTNNYNNWAGEVNACGRGDTMYLFFRVQTGLQYAVMVDTTAIIPPLIFASFAFHEPSAVLLQDTVYAFYHDKTKLYLRKGSNAGFLPPVVVDSSSGAAVKAPEACGSDSGLGLFYYTYPADSIFFLYSALPFASFSKKFIALGKTPKAFCLGNFIFLAYQDAGSDPLVRVAFDRSYDFGTTFDGPVYLSDSLNSIGDISIGKHGNTVVVAWETNGKIYSRTSYDNGGVFGSLDSVGKDFAYLPTLYPGSAGVMEFYCQRGDSNTDGYVSTDPDYEHPKHGTEMVSLVSGYLDGTYMGVAPSVMLLVAKTENPDKSYEFSAEEDTWIAGLEWLESQGTDIVSSSLGYTSWYHWPEDYDGRTSAASIAASEAVKRGLIIVNSSGNFAVPTPPQIVVPGDADGVITVGGIDTLFNHAKWESQGTIAYAGYFPTTDHTSKKPEIVCLCAAPVVVDPDSQNSYLYSFGTSGATALVSGMCALLLEGHPSWTPDSVSEALCFTASLASAPNDSMGYGWPDALAAFYKSPPHWDSTTGNHFLTPFPNPLIISRQPLIYLPFKLDNATSVEFRIYSVNGRLIKKEERPEGTGQLGPGIYADTDPGSPSAAFMWDGKDDDGLDAGSGLYYCVLMTRGMGNDVTKVAVIR